MVRTLDNERYEEFLWFLQERQRIWHVKEILKCDPPWTDDDTLQKAKFCNIYRELDRLTIYEYNCIKDLEPKEQLYCIALFRHTISPHTFELLRSKPTEEQFRRTFKELLEKKQAVSNALMFTPGKFKTWEDCVWAYYNDLNSKIDTLYSNLMDAINLGNIKDVIKNVLSPLLYMGDFKCYEMYISLTYLDWFPFTEDDYVFVGDGSLYGMEILHGLEKVHGIGQVAALEILPELRDKVHKDLLDTDYIWIPQEFQFSKKYEHKFTLRTLEHSMCEYRKRWCLMNGAMPMRRKYEYV